MKNAKKEEKKEERKLRGVYLTDEAVANISPMQRSTT